MAHTDDPRIAASSRRPLYIQRVNAAIDYAEQHLADELTLERLAAVAHFSPFHFHRIFTTLVGETPARFINRIRIEKAATLLVQRPHLTITQIGSRCGLPNPSSFARLFRETFGMSATEWRRGGYQTYERAPGGSYRDLVGNLGVLDAGFGIADVQYDERTSAPVWQIRCGDLGTAQVVLEDIPTMDVGYVRYTGPYQGLGEVFSDLFTRLMRWAQPRQLVGPDTWILSVYHDNPSITADEKLRVSACVPLPADLDVSGDVGRMQVGGGVYAVGRFELGEKDYGTAWFSLAGGWLPDSGYEPDDRYPFERFIVGRSAASADRHVADICLPVRPLQG